MTPYRDAIASIESAGSGDYAALGPVTGSGDRAYGRYQVMGNNIPEWTRRALGRAMTPEEFLASPEAQDATFDAIFGGYVNKYGPEGAARAWFSGEGGMSNPGASDGYNTNDQYASKFMGALGQAGGQNALTGAAAGFDMGRGTDFNPDVYADRINALTAALDEQQQPQRSFQPQQPMLHQSNAIDPRYAMRFFG